MYAELVCAALKIANARTIAYSKPPGPDGKLEEGSEATYTCNPGFKKSGGAKRVCRSGKFSGKPQRCVGAFCVEEVIRDGRAHCEVTSHTRPLRMHACVCVTCPTIQSLIVAQCDPGCNVREATAYSSGCKASACRAGFRVSRDICAGEIRSA